MGRPRRPRVLRLHEELLALRQRASGGLPGGARHRGAQRPASAVLGAGEVGSEAALDDAELAPNPSQDRPRVRPLGPFRPIRILARGGIRIGLRGLHARPRILTWWMAASTLGPSPHPSGCVYRVHKE